MMTVIAGIAVLGLIALGVVQIILSTKERESLHKMIKSKDLVEYVTVTEDEEDADEEVEKEIPIDEIPFLSEEKSRE